MNDPHGKYIDGFDARHSSNGDGPIKVGDWLLYPTGARCEADPNGSYHEPPVDEHERNRVIANYWKLRLERVVTRFDAVKEQFFQRIAASANFPFPPEPSVAEMQAATDPLRETIKRLKAKHHNAAKLTEPKFVPSPMEMPSERAKRAVDVLNSIEI